MKAAPLVEKIKGMEKLPLDVEIDLRSYGRYIAFLRRHITHAVKIVWGIVVPPHESIMLSLAWMGYRNNTYVCSRGTSKTFTIGSLFAPTKALLTRGSDSLIASASRFRGGKLVMQDSGRLLRGNLKSQSVGNRWGVRALTHSHSTIKRQPDMWIMEFKSNSQVFTIPTNNDEAVRGIRANNLIIDERNTFDGETIQKVYLPFLNVGSDFEYTALGSEGNQLFQVGTIDYTYRDWYKEIKSNEDLAKIQYLIGMARRKQEWETYDKLMLQHGHRIKESSFSVIRIDYTDLLIPTTIGKYKIHYPGAEHGKNIKWDDRDQIEYIYTYPVNKRQLEEPLDEGLSDPESWEAEQRNVFIHAAGNVYPFDLVEKVTGPIFSEEEEIKKGWLVKKEKEYQDERYMAPILYECLDPCVLGVDVARTSDFSAFVVIRLGYLPSEFFSSSVTYSLKTHSGQSPWSNVVWAEQHQKMTAQEVANTIREFRLRYNIVGLRNLPGLAMDARGGGAAVRDELVMPSPSSGEDISNWKEPQKVFDPEDKDKTIGQNLLADETAWPGLRLLWTTDTLNQELVGFSKAQMQADRLYIPPYRAPKFRDDPDKLLHIGYVGVQVLKHQLLRVQANLTPSGKSVRYEMPGDPNKLENKRDMLFAFLYACYAARLWYTEHQQKQRAPPVAYGTVIRL